MEFISIEKHRKILALIATIRESHSMMPNIFLFGSCFNLYLILKQVYPEAIPYYDVNHVITKIGDRCYDIAGEVPEDRYAPLTSFYPKAGLAQAIKEMLRAEFPLESAEGKTCV